MRHPSTASTPPSIAFRALFRFLHIVVPETPLHDSIQILSFYDADAFSCWDKVNHVMVIQRLVWIGCSLTVHWAATYHLFWCTKQMYWYGQQAIRFFRLSNLQPGPTLPIDGATFHSRAKARIINREVENILKFRISKEKNEAAPTVVVQV
jgi:hypothetical protein